MLVVGLFILHTLSLREMLPDGREESRGFTENRFFRIRQLVSLKVYKLYRG